jgi:hypothetical protein
MPEMLLVDQVTSIMIEGAHTEISQSQSQTRGEYIQYPQV